MVYCVLSTPSIHVKIILRTLVSRNKMTFRADGATGEGFRPLCPISKQSVDLAAHRCDAKHLICKIIGRPVSMKSISYPLLCIFRANANSMQLAANGRWWCR